MLNKFKNRKQAGFTIIEVLIVLAIAGLILLVVLLAVPALQRNSRNTTIKNDAAGLAGAISSFESNNDGAAVASITSAGLISGSSGSTEQAKLQPATTVATLSAAPTTVITHGTLSVWLAHNCAGSGSSRAVAIWYSIETTSAETTANNNKCVDS